MMTTSRKYVAVIYDDETQEKLCDWCESNGFDMTKNYSSMEQKATDFEFHTTVSYSENEVSMKNETLPFNGEVFPVRFKLLGDNEDIPVLVVSSPELNNIRSEFEQRGLRDKWPDYLPHISLSYVRKDYDLTGIKLPDFRMNFGRLTIEDINEEV